MTTTVVGACMLSALLLMKDQLVAHTPKVQKMVAAAAARESKAVAAAAKEGGSLAKAANSLKVGGAHAALVGRCKLKPVDGRDDSACFHCLNLRERGTRASACIRRHQAFALAPVALESEIR